jgi:hypothetical protein
MVLHEKHGQAGIPFSPGGPCGLESGTFERSLRGPKEVGAGVELSAGEVNGEVGKEKRVARRFFLHTG